jgi:hypothetical protein
MVRLAGDVAAVTALGIRYNNLETELNATLDEWAAVDRKL